MECPVCYSTKRKNSLVTLECGHAFCFSCSLEWLTKHGGNCPLCRETSVYFSRETRSKKRADAVFVDFAEKIHSFVCLFDVLPMSVEQEIKVMANLLDNSILQHKHEWYRPHMRSVLGDIYKPVKGMMETPEFQSCRPELRSVFMRFEHHFALGSTR